MLYICNTIRVLFVSVCIIKNVSILLWETFENIARKKNWSIMSRVRKSTTDKFCFRSPSSRVSNPIESPEVIQYKPRVVESLSCLLKNSGRTPSLTFLYTTFPYSLSKVTVSLSKNVVVPPVFLSPTRPLTLYSLMFESPKFQSPLGPNPLDL